MVSDPSNQCCELKKDLIILQWTMHLVGLAIEAYQDMLLGWILNDTIGKELERCLEVLQALHGMIQVYQPSLISTSINFLRGRFLGTWCELDELATWRGKLSECQWSVVGCLWVLDSCVSLWFHAMLSSNSSSICLRASWQELRSGVRSKCISPKYFNRFLPQQSCSLPYIPVNKIIVVDHLGWNLPILTVFCSTAEVHYSFKITSVTSLVFVP